MKKLMIVLLVLGSFSAFAKDKCPTLANQELKAVQAVHDFYYELFDRLDADTKTIISENTLALLSDGEDHLANGLFTTDCDANISTVSILIEQMKYYQANERAQIALLELLKLSE